MKKICDFFLDHRNLALFVTGASIAALISVYVMQYGFDIQPCHLCLLQRKPYMAAIALGLLAFALAGKKPKVTFALLLLAGAAFLANIGISFFHTGVEQKWWPLPGGCEGGLPENATIEELKEYYAHHVKPVNCGEPAFVLFGISLTGYNFLLSLFLTAFTFFHAIKGYKRDGKTQA